MSSRELQLTYFPLRARGEPVLLLLADSGIPFALEEVSPEAWVQWRRSRKITHDVYPYSALPVLRVRDKSAPGRDFVLAETSAILSFLEEFLAPPGTPLLKDACLEVRTHAQMIKEASLFFLTRILDASADRVVYHPKRTVGQLVYNNISIQDWLAPPKREKLWRGLVTRYLQNTEGALSSLNARIRVIPHAEDTLKGYTAAVVTAINLITDMFPSGKVELGNGGQYALCGRVWAAVGERARIVEYWRENEVEGKPWTISDYGTAEWIARAAKL